MAILLAAACAPLAGAPTQPPPDLHPYSTLTPEATSDLVTGFVVTAGAPLASPTPATYSIKSGDTLSQIAERAHVTVDKLLLANPGLDPNALRVGETLLIPAATSSLALATATPVPLEIQEVACRFMATGAAWCFALIHNSSPEPLENITGIVSVLDSTGTVLRSEDVALPLDLLPSGSALPLAVPFPGPLPLDLKPQVQILTAMRASTGTPIYLPAFVGHTLTEVSWSGRTADVTGELILPAGPTNATEIWLAAVAYDSSGRLLGWRRWESPGAMKAGTSMPFQFTVYSLAGAIDRVDLVVQAR